jgi:hypothetical protein
VYASGRRNDPSAKGVGTLELTFGVSPAAVSLVTELFVSSGASGVRVN